MFVGFPTDCGSLEGQEVGNGRPQGTRLRNCAGYLRPGLGVLPLALCLSEGSDLDSRVKLERFFKVLTFTRDGKGDGFAPTLSNQFAKFL